MGLPVRQRRKLGHIDRTLRGTDPKLVALYAIFGRLTRDEEIPRFEQLRHGLMAKLAWLQAVLSAIGRRLHIRIRRRRRIALFYPLAIALTVGSIVLAVRSGPAKNCIPSRTAAAAKNYSRTNLCRPQSYMSPLTYGH